MLRPFALAISFLLIVPDSIYCRQTTAPAQAAAVLAQAIAALSGSATVNDITLTGTAERIVGSDDETGTVIYKAMREANRLDLSLSGGTRAEVRASGSNGPEGNWVGPDGTVHEIAQHNLLTDVSWFPVFTLANVLSASNAVLTFVGPEVKNGASVLHIRSSQQASGASVPSDVPWQHLTEVNIYLDPSSLRTVAVGFNTHPDDNALFDIPVEFRFSDYRNVGTATIPFHVQQLLNGNLFLNVQFDYASINSGLSSSSSEFSIK